MGLTLVTDGQSKACVAIARSLGKKGVSVAVGSDRIVNPTFFSRYVDKRIIYPSPEKMPHLFVSRLYDLSLIHI